MEEKKSNIGKIVLFIIAILIIYHLATKDKTSNKWSYMICSEVMDDKISCQKFHLVRLNDCNTQEECFSKARDYLSVYPQYKSFEVGQGCRWDKDWGSILICKFLCDRFGNCHK